MRKNKWNFNIDWNSKIVDLIIVIVGITIAFRLNTWNETISKNNEAKEYLKSFYDENNSNKEELITALEYSVSSKVDIDSLKQILLSKRYGDNRIKALSASMMGFASFNPSITTMENITASGEFDLIVDIELRKRIIRTYNTYKTTFKLEGILTDYVNEYITPFFFDNVRFSDFSSINTEFIKNPAFENIVIGYELLLSQQITGYKNNLEKIEALNEKLLDARNKYE